MLTRIFKKRGADKSKGHKARLVAPSSVKKIVPTDEAVPQFDITVDEGMAALHSLLSELPHIEVAQAAKERGWAKMQRELEKHPVRAAASAAPKGVAAKPVLSGNQTRTLSTGHSRGWRVAIGSLAAVAAIMIGVLSSYGAGLFNGSISESTTTAVAENSTGSTQTSTSSATSETTRSTGGSTTESTPGTSSTNSNTTTVTTGTGTTQGNTTTSGSTGPSNSTTTVTTNTDVTQLAAADVEQSAEQLALDLGRALCGDGDLASIRRHVSSSAQSALTQMILSLKAPSGVQKVATKDLSATTVRITLEFNDIDDETTDTNGQPLAIHPRFNLTIQVNANGATVIGISRGS